MREILVDNLTYDIEFPDQCPICHHYGESRLVQFSKVKSDSGVQVVFQCAFTGCKSYFIGYYGPAGQSAILELKPIKPNPTQFSESILSISPTFIKIFLEAEEGSHLGLREIAGPGYRKAFEFLIKDYAKSLAPDKAEQIEKSFSGTVVSEYITDPRIQMVAKRTLWVGNDESHYLRKWTAHDTEDLVTLIRLSVNWIEIDLLSKRYKSDMPEEDE